MNRRASLCLGERALGVVLGASYVVWLLASERTLGYARDEGFYFYAAARYEAWFELLASNPERALEPAVLDYHWSVNSEHPAFIKALFAASHALLFERLHLFTEEGTAYRFVGMVLAGVSIAAAATTRVSLRMIVTVKDRVGDSRRSATSSPSSRPDPGTPTPPAS